MIGANVQASSKPIMFYDMQHGINVIDAFVIHFAKNEHVYHFYDIALNELLSVYPYLHFVQFSPNYQKYVNFKRDECRMPLAPTLYRAAPLHEGVVPLIQTEWQRKSLLNRQWSIVLTSPRRRVYFHKAFA